MKYATGLLLLAAACSDYGFETPERVTDEWVVQGNVDIVVFGDTSDSMTDTLETLTDNFFRFVSRLEDAESDWHLIAVTGPDGCGNNGILTADTPDWDLLFQDGITTKPEEDFVDEWGLYNAAMALDESVPGGCNEGFLRDDALLHIVFISDEDDNSPGWDGPDPDYWKPYVDRYLAAKQGNLDKVHLTAVGGPEPIGCSYADFARGYWESVYATGGDFLSICDDWVFQLEALADTAVTQSAFELTEPAIESTIQVFVDGLERDDGWSYRAKERKIVFDAHAPYVGQTVRVRYDVPLSAK